MRPSNHSVDASPAGNTATAIAHRLALGWWRVEPWGRVLFVSLANRCCLRGATGRQERTPVTRRDLDRGAQLREAEARGSRLPGLSRPPLLTARRRSCGGCTAYSR